MQPVCADNETSRNGRAPIRLDLEVRDPNVIDYLARFQEKDRLDRALGALSVGVIAIRSAGPTLDAEVVGRQLQRWIGPGSHFANSLDPNNKMGIIALILDRAQVLLEENRKAVLGEFSLDDKGSALSRFEAMQTNFLRKLGHALGVEEGRAAEVERGPAKGLNFQDTLYCRVIEWARQLGDKLEFVANTPGACGRKTGDYLVTLGDSTGAPGHMITFEAKNERYTLKHATDELQRAKKNREAACGIFAFAKGCEPPEVGDFHHVGDDFYCTVDRKLLDAGQDLLYIETAYKIARVQVAAAVRKETTGTLDLQRIRGHIDSFAGFVNLMGDLARRARTVKKHGLAIDNGLRRMKGDLDARLTEMLRLLNVQPTE
jgi:hypothetical protein